MTSLDMIKQQAIDHLWLDVNIDLFYFIWIAPKNYMQFCYEDNFSLDNYKDIEYVHFTWRFWELEWENFLIPFNERFDFKKYLQTWEDKNILEKYTLWKHKKYDVFYCFEKIK